MKNERILDALEKVDEELIMEAAPGNRPPKKAPNKDWMKWGAMAACAVVVVAVSMPQLIKHNKYADIVEQPEAEKNIDDVGVAEEGAPLAPAVTDMDLESISHIEILSGLTGQRITIKDIDIVHKVVGDILSLDYEKKGSAEGYDGYSYFMRFYNENYDELGTLYITEENGHQISYNGYFYLVEDDLNVNVDYLEELLKDAPPAEPEETE